MSKPADQVLPVIVDPRTLVLGYHAHIYYEAATKALVEGLVRALTDSHLRSAVRGVGRFHDQPVGPHPRPSVQIAMSPEGMALVLPWLAMNRGDLTIFIHPETGDEMWDHVHNAIWLGEMLELVKLTVLGNPNHRDVDEMRDRVRRCASRSR